MKAIKRIFGWLFKAFAALAILGAIIAAILIFASRQERALAREFISLVAQDRYSEAHDLFSQDFKQVFPVDLMKSQFRPSQYYTSISFKSINWTGSQMVLVGQAVTEDGCTSPITFAFVDELITYIRVYNPCLIEGQSA